MAPPDRSSPAASDSISDSSAPDGKSLGPANPTPPADGSSSGDGLTCPSTPTSDPSTPERHASTSSLAASPARISRTLAAAPGLAASDPASGSPTPTPFAYFDRDSSSWRTCQGSLLEDSGEFCTTWPRQGTWDLGFAYELPTSALRISESGSSSSPLLPSPDGSLFNDGKSLEAYEARKARELEKGYNGNGGGTPLAMAVRLLPTPGANDSTGAEGPTREARQETGETGGPALRDIAHLLPTPMTDPDSANGHGRNLGREARLLPTPQTTDAAAAARHTTTTGVMHAGTSLTDATRIIERGDRTPPPSSDGSSPSDEQLPDQLTLEDA